MTASWNKTNESSKTKESFEPCSTGEIYVKYPKEAVFGIREENLVTGNN